MVMTLRLNLAVMRVYSRNIREEIEAACRLSAEELIFLHRLGHSTSYNRGNRVVFF